jgi:peroxiredoxin
MKRSFLGREVTLVLLVVSVAMNLILARQLNQARTALAPPPFQTGHIAPVVRLLGERGNAIELDYGKGTLPTLLYWLSPSCGWCEVNIANFRALAAQAQGKYRFVAVSSAPPGELVTYAQRHRIDFPIYTIRAEAARLYRLGGTPASVLISAEGTFVKRWDGAYPPSKLNEIENTLSVKLPGVVAKADETATR